jgi:phosphoglucosamine mutase
MLHDSPRSLFGTSGIRGLVNESLTPEVALKAGLAFAAFLANQGTVVVGRDVRTQSQLIQNALTTGLLAGGVNVVDCGVTVTPALLHALKNYRYEGGVSVTGSHTPAQMTGILLFLGDTGEMDQSHEVRFEEIYRDNQPGRMPWNQLGKLAVLEVKENYFEALRKHLGLIQGYRIVADPGNGAAYDTLSSALESMGCEVITINEEPDGRFPSRSPYPQPSTLGQLSRAVVENGADLGIGTDSDGDRAIFVTSTGEALWGDITGALFAMHELDARNGGRVIVTINTSSLIQRVCKEHAGLVTVTRVGPPAMVEGIRKNSDAIFAIEESGKYIWPQVIMYGDAAFATGKLLQIMKSTQKSLNELRGDLPRFHLLKQNIPCPFELEPRAMELLMRSWKASGNEQVLAIDGLRVDYQDHSWFLVRPSGTEPVLRCYGEAPDLEKARLLLNIATGLANDSVVKLQRQKEP